MRRKRKLLDHSIAGPEGDDGQRAIFVARGHLGPVDTPADVRDPARARVRQPHTARTHHHRGSIVVLALFLHQLAPALGEALSCRPQQLALFNVCDDELFSRAMTSSRSVGVVGR